MMTTYNTCLPTYLTCKWVHNTQWMQRQVAELTTNHPCICPHTPPRPGRTVGRPFVRASWQARIRKGGVIRGLVGGGPFALRRNAVQDQSFQNMQRFLFYWLIGKPVLFKWFISSSMFSLPLTSKLLMERGRRRGEIIATQVPIFALFFFFKANASSATALQCRHFFPPGRCVSSPEGLFSEFLSLSTRHTHSHTHTHTTPPPSQTPPAEWWRWMLLLNPPTVKQWKY